MPRPRAFVPCDASTICTAVAALPETSASIVRFGCSRKWSHCCCVNGDVVTRRAALRWRHDEGKQQRHREGPATKSERAKVMRRLVLLTS